MSSSHVPVLLKEMCQALMLKEGGVYLDGTFGAGGYTQAILGVADTKVLALDRDPNAIREGQALVAQVGGRLILKEGRFSEMRELAASHGLLDGIVLDIGVSSMQLDQAGRGFSFRLEGPLDMRMAQQGRSAADIVNEESEEEIARIIYIYGEERASRRIARAIVAARLEHPFATTKELAECVAKVIPHHAGQIHPATKVFQALRIAVNEELDELSQALEVASGLLKPGGRLVIVTFHSLEDRIVKQYFAQHSGRGISQSRLLPFEQAPPIPLFHCPKPQPIGPGEEEVAQNPRARSAKLRYGERC